MKKLLKYISINKQNKWYTKKEKSSPCGKGCSQRPEVDFNETYSPVARMTSVISAKLKRFQQN